MPHLRVDLIMSNYHTVLPTWKESTKILGYNKIYFIENGEGVIYINNKAYYPKPNEILFIPFGCDHGYSNISSKRFKKHWCHFNAFIGSTPLTDLIDIPILKKAKDPKKLKRIFDELVLYDNSDEPFAPLKA